MRLAVPTLDRPQPASPEFFAGCPRRSQRAVPSPGLAGTARARQTRNPRLDMLAYGWPADRPADPVRWRRATERAGTLVALLLIGTVAPVAPYGVVADPRQGSCLEKHPALPTARPAADTDLRRLIGLSIG
jgi:hypothetical protein